MNETQKKTKMILKDESSAKKPKSIQTKPQIFSESQKLVFIQGHSRKMT